MNHDDKDYDPSKTMEKSIAETMGYLENKKDRKEKSVRPPCTWHGPDPGLIKLNSDSVVRIEQGVAGGGGVARDEHGFKGAWCKIYEGIVDPLSIEALAFRDAVSFAKQRGFTRILCESDCDELVRLRRARKTQRSLIAPVLGEVAELVTSFF
jgi:hypothetical protein